MNAWLCCESVRGICALSATLRWLKLVIWWEKLCINLFLPPALMLCHLAETLTFSKTLHLVLWWLALKKLWHLSSAKETILLIASLSTVALRHQPRVKFAFVLATLLKVYLVGLTTLWASHMLTQPLTLTAQLFGIWQHLWPFWR